MMKKMFALSALSLLSFSNIVSADTYLDCKSEPQSCERVMLVDFDGNPSVQNSSTQFQDWTTISKDTYSGSEGIGSTTILGNIAEYNYQGISGNIKHQFRTGEYIIATYYNSTNQDIFVTPNVSFDDSDRIFYGVSGIWFSMYNNYIPANSSKEVLIRFDNSYGKLPYTNLININSGYSGNRGLFLDKIEYLQRTDPEIINHTACNEVICTPLTVFDLTQPTIESIKQSTQLIDFTTHSPFNFTYLVKEGSGLGLTLNKGVTNGSYLHYSVQRPEGTHTFKPGEKIIVEVASRFNYDVALDAYISFEDYDTKTWGATGKWYKLSDIMVPAGHINSTVEFTFDELTAGNFKTINVAIMNSNTGGKLILKKATYLTNQTFKAKF